MYRVAVRERVREGDVPPPARSMKKTTTMVSILEMSCIIMVSRAVTTIEATEAFQILTTKLTAPAMTQFSTSNLINATDYQPPPHEYDLCTLALDWTE